MIRKLAVTSTLEEDFKFLGLDVPPLTEGKKSDKKEALTEGKKAPKIKGKKVLLGKKKLGEGKGKAKDTAGVVPKKSPVGVMPKGKKVAESKQPDKVATLLEDVKDILSTLNAVPQSDVVQGFEDLAAIYGIVGKRFAQLGESLESTELLKVGSRMERRSAVVANLAEQINTHLVEGRGPSLDMDLIENKFRAHARTVLEALQLFTELNDAVGDEEAEKDAVPPEVDGEEDHEEPDEDQEGGPSDHDADNAGEEGEEGEEGGEEGDEEGDESAEDDDMSFGGDDKEEEVDEDEDVLSRLEGGDESEESEEGDEDEESEEGDEEEDEEGDEEDESDDEDEESDEDGEDEESDEEDDEEEMDESVVDTSAPSATFLGKKVPQRSEDDEPEKGEDASVGPQPHGGSSKDALLKGYGVMKAKLEHKLGKGRR